MYIRKTMQLDKKTGRPYATHRLIESYRNAQGKPRNQMLLNLGTHFSIPQEEWKTLADRIEEILKGQQDLFFDASNALESEAQRIAKLLVMRGFKESELTARSNKAGSEAIEIEEYQEVSINSLTHLDIRHVGAEMVGVHTANQLGLSEILSECGFNDKQKGVALSTIIARLVSPGSELFTHRYLTKHSALDEVLNRDNTQLPLHELYSIADRLLTHKESIETALYEKECHLFNLNETLMLYDLTNTYFEGSALQNAKAKYGRSKEKRSDCCLVALGMVLNSAGFPKKTKIYEGNISEPSTFEEMIGELNQYAQKPTVVMDAGIATEANIDWLKANGFQYIVVSRNKKVEIPENAQRITLKSDPGNEVSGYLSARSGSDEVELYCHSQAKEAKSQLMKSKFEQRLEGDLTRMNAGLANQKGSLKKYTKIVERIGRLKEKYSSTAKYYDITVSANENKTEAIAITFCKNEARRNQKADGMYCLRSNHVDMEGKTLWNTYTMLTELEAAFRHLKSELGLRPVYHQLEGRVDAHLFISILAYHLLNSIRFQLKEAGIHESWHAIRTMLNTHVRLTTTLKTRSGEVLHIRKNALPTVEQRRIYEALKMRLPGMPTVKRYC